MEVALFALDCLALLWLCVKVVKSEREPSQFDLGIFRYEERRELPPKPHPNVSLKAPTVQERRPPQKRQG
jgi:hypothetical protein